MKICFAFLFILSLFSSTEAEELVTVFEAGKEGYPGYRIPVVVQAANGDLLAFCEARQGGDASEIDLVQKRSRDEGKTWGALQVVQESADFSNVIPDESEITIGNPAPVVDLLDTEFPGRIWMPFTLENDRVFVVYSDDHGATWSKRREITDAVKIPEWGWYATGPVHSIQIQRGEHRGRLVIACDHRLGEDGEDRGASAAHVVFSDDHGKTWELGAIDETYQDDLHANETTVVELNDGTLYFNTRDQKGAAPGTRGEAWSVDGGESFTSKSKKWEGFRPVVGVLDPPVVQGSLLRAGEELLVFSGPDESGPSGKGRSDMRMRYSTDEAETWEDGPLIHAGPAAYSDMVLINEGEIGLLFEASDPGHKNAYQRIVFTSIPRDRIAPIAWSKLPDVPDDHGFAGPFAGDIEGTLIVAGGANFPGRPPWEGGSKAWYDGIFVLSNGGANWKKAEQRLPEDLAYGVSVSLPDRGSIAMLGGSNQSNEPTAGAFEMSLGADGIQINPLPILPVPLAEGSGVATGNVIYLFSGRSTVGTVRKAWRIDLDGVDPAWEELPWPEKARGRVHSVAGVSDGSLFVFGGRDYMTDQPILNEEDRCEHENLDFLRDCYRLDPETLTWSRLSDLPKGLSAAPACAITLGNGRLLMVGGVGAEFLEEQFAARPEINGQGHEHPGFSRTIWAYDPDKDLWTDSGSLPLAYEVPVTAPVVKTGAASFVIPSGEIKPGVRTVQILAGGIQP